MAKDNLVHLRRHQARGPYALAGYSGGALTAFEMARQLAAEGETVTNLFIFDTFAPGFAQDFRPKIKLTIGQRLRSEWELLRDEGIGLFFERLWAFVQNRLPRGPIARLTRWLHPTMHRMQFVSDTWRKAASAYTGGSYSGRVTLLKIKPRSLMARLAYEQDSTLGWRRVVTYGNLSSALVPGDHLRMIEDPNAAALAETIEARLRVEQAPAEPSPTPVR
jgi:thioesterase domain-containing protein